MVSVFNTSLHLLQHLNNCRLTIADVKPPFAQLPHLPALSFKGLSHALTTLAHSGHIFLLTLFFVLLVAVLIAPQLAHQKPLLNVTRNHH
jgi:hypothetical protein